MADPNPTPTPKPTPKPTLGVLLRRGLRLRCPACGEGKLFRTWFAMHDPCTRCQRKFNREPGYLLGSIYFNYGVTALLVLALYLSLSCSDTLSSQQRLVTVGLFSLAFPIWFFRYARSFWIAMDEQFDPWPNEKEQRERTRLQKGPSNPTPSSYPVQSSNPEQ